MLEALFAAAAKRLLVHPRHLEPRAPARLAQAQSGETGVSTRAGSNVCRLRTQYPELTASLFNESFLTIEATPELAKFLTASTSDHTNSSGCGRSRSRRRRKPVSSQSSAEQPRRLQRSFGLFRRIVDYRTQT